MPCYNEEKRFPKKKFLEFANRQTGYRFLFVDDGSRDKTLQILDSLRQENPKIFDVLEMGRNSGKAEAVRLGFLQGLQSKADFLAYWDADLATPLETLPDFLAIFEEHPQVEMVFGSRIKLLGSDIRRHALRHYLGRVFATAASFVLNLEIYDTQCGAKMFRVTETLAKIFQDPFHTGWVFDVELIARYLYLRRRKGESDVDSTIYEFSLPVWHDIPGSKVKPIDFFLAFPDLIKIYLTYR